MKSLFDKPSLEEIESRINQLSPDTQKKWGKMEVDQMLAHCVGPLSVATDQIKIPRLFIGRILGPIFKAHFYNDKPLSKNSPTAPQFIVSDRRNFEAEKGKVVNDRTQISSGW